MLGGSEDETISQSCGIPFDFLLFISRDRFFGIDEHATGEDEAVTRYYFLSDLCGCPELVFRNAQKLTDLIK